MGHYYSNDALLFPSPGHTPKARSHAGSNHPQCPFQRPHQAPKITSISSGSLHSIPLPAVLPLERILHIQKVLIQIITTPAATLLRLRLLLWLPTSITINPEGLPTHIHPVHPIHPHPIHAHATTVLLLLLLKRLLLSHMIRQQRLIMTQLLHIHRIRLPSRHDAIPASPLATSSDRSTTALLPILLL